tara:strand:+ start:1231 stop:1812 length:582 start_codon:yes stop_codon:yes gene_type:complete
MNEHKGIKLSFDKREDKNTVTHQFKIDLIDMFEDDKWKSCSVLEVACYKGYTTSILSKLFERVWAVESNKSFLESAKKYNEKNTNIRYIRENVYAGRKWKKFPIADVVFIDCNHDYKSVTSDLEQSIEHLNDGGFIVMDDYGLFWQLKDAVHDFIKKMDGEITIHKYIGEPEGSTARKGKVMNDWEGIILKYK